MAVQFMAENLRKDFSGRTVLNEISFSLRDGRSLAVTGPNGSGKSTLIRLCAGLLRADAGQVLLFINGGSAPVAQGKNCSLVAPSLKWYAQLSARENIALVAGSDKVRAQRAEDSAVRFGLGADLDTLTGNYSSGMMQRFSLAVAFSLEPALLLLDEPGSFLDKRGKELFLTILAEIAPSCVTIIATNDAGEASLCEKELRLG